MALQPPVCHRQGHIYKKGKSSKIFLTSTHLGKKEMHYNDIHEALYQNCESHGPWVRGSGLTAGLIWQYDKSVFNLRKSSLVL